MTAEQFTKGAQTYHNLKTLTSFIKTFDNELSKNVIWFGFANEAYWLDDAIRNDLENYRLLMYEMIKDDVKEFLNDHLARLNGELESI